MHRRVSPDPRGPGTACVAVLAVLLWAWSVAPALAYPRPEAPFNTFTCDQCHATAGEDTAWDGSGPHAGYSTVTNKCVLCHSVHVAPATSVLLLRGPTVSQTCLLCHDGTGSGEGPYHSITAYAGAGSIEADHAYESTAIIPGGSETLDHVLSCADCHSVHGAKTVVPFIRDSTRAQVPPTGSTVSDCLLRSDLMGDAAGTYPEYGAQWCAACHDQRHSQSTVINHPVNTSYTFGYGDVITHLSLASLRFPNYDALNDLAIGMGQTNGGYIMGPVPEAGDGAVRTSDRANPMCQQCHEDARDVEAIFRADAYSPNTPPYTNPAFLTFPHQTTNATLLVETDDDLCLNCHLLSTLP